MGTQDDARQLTMRRTMRVAFLTIIGLSFVAPMFGSSASAATDDGEIVASVTEQKQTDDGVVKVPVEGVLVKAVGAAGSAEGKTDATGKVTLKVPKEASAPEHT